MVAEACFNFGESSNQWWKLNAGGLLQFKDGEACGVPEESQPAGDAETRGGVLRGATCKAKFQTVPSESDAKKVRLVAEGTPNQCLSEGEGQTWKEQGKPLLFRPCSSGDSKQVFTIAHHYTGNSHQLKTSSGLCVDAANGAGPLAYECHNVGDDPRQQQFDVKPDSAMLWNGRTDNGDETFCIDPKPALGVLTVCAASAENVPKAGQGFKRHDEQGGFFQLRDTISGNCLTPVDGGSDGNPQVASKPCGVEDRPDDQRWSINEAGNIINKGRNLCIDSGDQVSPVFLYTCYAPGENPKQTFKIHDNGQIEIPRSWADNGRVRYLSKCLDTQPVEAVGLTMVDCKDTNPSDSTWEEIWHETPMETQMYLDASKTRGNLRSSWS
jgi:hypothetical protein